MKVLRTSLSRLASQASIPFLWDDCGKPLLIIVARGAFTTGTANWVRRVARLGSTIISTLVITMFGVAAPAQEPAVAGNLQ